MKYLLPTLLCGGMLLTGYVAPAQSTDSTPVVDTLPPTFAEEAVNPINDVSPMPSVVPPSPNAAALGKYGFVPVSLSTGASAYEIPLYEFRSGKLTLPVSISYYGGGIKVDELAAWTGLGWVLNGGGVITRVVRDRPDEETYFNGSMRYPERIRSEDPESLEFIKRAGENESYDSEPDQFAFNFMGYSGKFVFDQNGAVRIVPHQKMLVERFYESQELGFRVTTADGIVYEFGGGNATESSKVFPTGAECSRNLDDFVETAWYLTKVTHPGGDELTFTYNGVVYQSFEHTSSITQTLTKVQGQGGCTGGNSCDEPGLVTCENATQMNVAVLASVEGELGSIEFSSEKDRLDGPGRKLDAIKVLSKEGAVKRQFDFTYEFASSATSYASPATKDTDRYRMFLTSVSEGGGEKVHRFTYKNKEQLPPRLSYAQDHWGFFNGKDNINFVPKDLSQRDGFGNPLFAGYGGNRSPDPLLADIGLLTKITYPTGGYTELVWESHSYYGTEDWEGGSGEPLTPFRIVASVPEDSEDPRELVITNNTLVNTVAQEVEIEITSRVSVSDPDPRFAFSRYSIYDETRQQSIANSENVALGTNRTIQIELEEGHTYIFTVEASTPGVATGMNFGYRDGDQGQPPTSTARNIAVGGARIKKTVSYDPVQSSSTTKVYHYATKDDLTVSSGKVGRPPIYYDRYTSSRPCNGGTVDCSTFNCSYGQLRSSSLNTLYITGKSHVYYTFVTVSEGENFENGGQQHQFIINDDSPGNLVFGDEFINGVPYTNFGWNHGLEKEVQVFQQKANGTLSLVRKTTNDYARDGRNYAEVPGLVVRKKYDPVCVGDVTVTCDESNISYRQVYQRCNVNHTHQWLIGFGRTTCLAPGANNDAVITTWTHPCYNRTVGETIALPYNLDYMDAMEYKTISHWYYLEKTTTVTYDKNGNPLATVVQDYKYENPDHAQLTQAVVTDSKQRKQSTSYRYAEDFPDAETYGSNYLRDKHMHSQVLEQTITVGTTLTQKLTTTYTDPSGNVVPTTMKSYPTGTDEAQTTSYRYDDQGNVTEVLGPDGVPTAYVWGYNKTLPVAKIVGATRSQVDGRLGTDFHAGTASLSNVQAQTLRSGLQPAQVTTYTYDPLVGITSQTDPNGRTTTYHYDDLNRLDWIKNDEGHVVQKFDYQYVATD